MLTAEAIKNKFPCKEEKGRSLVEVYLEHNKKVAALVGDEFAPGTLERYTTSLKHTQELRKWKYGVDDIDTKNIDHAFVTDYELYLRSVRNSSFTALFDKGDYTGSELEIGQKLGITTLVATPAPAVNAQDPSLQRVALRLQPAAHL